MPTTAAREKLRQVAIDSFNSQDWPNKELIIVDGDATIGAKLNAACSKAKGDIIVRWDDDDWSADYRVSRQVSYLDAFNVQLTGFRQIYFWHEIKKKAMWYVGGAKDYCLGTSMCFRKSYWERNKFIDTSYGEDLEFQKLARAEKSVYSVPADQIMVARIHTNSTSSGRVSYPEIDVAKLPKEFFRRINAV